MSQMRKEGPFDGREGLSARRPQSRRVGRLRRRVGTIFEASFAVLLALLLGCCAVVGTVASAAAPIVYPDVTPGLRIEFPRDEGSHPQFRTEWWYVTGTVNDEQGNAFGFQVTFFRSRPGIDEANPSRFAAKQLLFAHAAVSDPRRGHLLHDERSARAGFGIAEAKEGQLDVAIDDWSLCGQPDGKSYRARVHAGEFQLDLEYTATQSPLIHGDGGYSQKGPLPTSASYYYTLPQLRTSGTIVIGSTPYRVTGVAWLDHEWSSAILDAEAQGWDWVGINLDDGGALMAFQMRTVRGRKHWAAATSRARDQLLAMPFDAADVTWEPLRRWRSARTGNEYPVDWRIRTGERTITLRALIDDQENDARGSTGTIYWEGAVIAYDESGRRIGRGYLELTGYGQRVSL